MQSFFTNINISKKWATLLLLCLISFCLKVEVTNAQDPVFSQFQAIPLLNNPAFTGISTAPRFTAQYRNQWPSLQKAYVTYGASYDQFFSKYKTGIGLTLINDDAGNGILKSNYATLSFGYSLKIKSDINVRIGANTTYAQNRLNWDKLIFYDQLDPYYGFTSGSGQPIQSMENRPISESISYFDFSSGMLLYSPRFYVGISLIHLNNPDNSFLKINNNLNEGIPLRWVYMGGYQIPLFTNGKKEVETYLFPTIIYTKQGDFRQINGGIQYVMKNILLGSSYRHTFGNSDAVIVSLGYQYQTLKINYSYDITVSGLAGASGGAHEVSFQLALKETKKVDYNDCFQIFR